METSAAPTSALPPVRSATAWTIAKIGAGVLSGAAVATGLALAGGAFLAGIVIEPTRADEARSAVANAAFGNSIGLLLLAVVAVGCAVIAGRARRGLRGAVVPAVLLSLGVYAGSVPVQRQIDRAHCMIGTASVTAC